LITNVAMNLPTFFFPLLRNIPNVSYPSFCFQSFRDPLSRPTPAERADPGILVPSKSVVDPDFPSLCSAVSGGLPKLYYSLFIHSPSLFEKFHQAVARRRKRFFRPFLFFFMVFFFVVIPGCPSSQSYRHIPLFCKMSDGFGYFSSYPMDVYSPSEFRRIIRSLPFSAFPRPASPSTQEFVIVGLSSNSQ